MNTVNRELSKLYNWFSSNKLSINVNKTNLILFGRSRKVVQDHNFSIIMNDVLLKQVTCTKFLGVHIDQDLN